MRSTTTTAAAIAAALITAAVLAGCSSPSTSSRGDADRTASSAAPCDAADAMFARMMIPHHEQAIEMSDTLLSKEGVDPRVRELAERIRREQAPEIRTMKGWLRSWNVPTPSATDHGGMSGMGHGGMMSDADMTELRRADGASAGPLFLTQMVAHHEGAVAMAKTERRQGRDPDAVALAKEIVASQTAEIDEMRALTSSLG